MSMGEINKSEVGIMVARIALMVAGVVVIFFSLAMVYGFTGSVELHQKLIPAANSETWGFPVFCAAGVVNLLVLFLGVVLFAAGAQGRKDD